MKKQITTSELFDFTFSLSKHVRETYEKTYYWNKITGISDKIKTNSSSCLCLCLSENAQKVLNQSCDTVLLTCRYVATWRPERHRRWDLGERCGSWAATHHTSPGLGGHYISPGVGGHTITPAPA
jgi:hypothetical protein